MKKPQPQSPGRDLLGGHASLEFGDCSIASSALNKSVTEMMADATDTRTVRYLGGEDETEIKQMLYGPLYATRRIALPGKNQAPINRVASSFATHHQKKCQPLRLQNLIRQY